MTGAGMLPVNGSSIDDLRSRVRARRWADGWHGFDAGQAGTDPDTLRRRIARLWTDGFSWRTVKAEIATLPSVTTDVNGTPVHSTIKLRVSP